MIAMTNADTRPTMMIESRAPKRTGAERAGMRILFSLNIKQVDGPGGGIQAKAENAVRDDALQTGRRRTRCTAGGDARSHARLQ